MKSFHQYITEVFDKPYKWSGGSFAKGSITPKNDAKSEPYWFKTSDGGKVEVIANHFWVGNLDKKLAGIVVKKEGHAIGIEFVKDDRYVLTGEGDAMRILATVLDITKAIIKKHEPSTIYFSADKSQDKSDRSGREKTGRAKAYAAIVKRFAGKVGYKSSTSEDAGQVRWQLTKK